MFFADFMNKVDGLLTTYISSKTVVVAGAIEPAVVTLGTIYVMVWGFLSMTGRIEEPIWEGMKRILTIAVIFGIGLKLWTYNTIIVNTFYDAPMQLAASVTGATNAVGVVDAIWDRGGTVAGYLWDKGGLLDGDFGFYLAGAAVWLIMGMVAVYAFFLLALSKVALAVILALGPLFIALLFFDSTKRFFESWIAQLANYALIAILASLVAALMLTIVSSYATQTAALGTAILTVDALNMVLGAALVFLFMRQVMPASAGLASGVALSSFGAISGVVNWGLRGTGRTGYQFGRGVLDGMRGEQRSRWDTLRRNAGNRLGSGMANGLGRLLGNRQGGTMVPRERVMPPSSVLSRRA